jgi:hypothetical protein
MRWSCLGLALLWLTASACGDQPCEEGAVKDCSCGEQPGEQICTSEGTWDECLCYDPDTPPDVEGRLFSITSDSVRWAEPMGLGSLIGAYVPPVLLQVGELEGINLEMMGTTGNTTEPPEQDLCVITTTFDSATLEGTWFDTGVVDFYARVSGALAVFYDFRVQADFSPTGLRFEDGTFEVTLDIREIEELFHQGVDETCALADSQFNAPCQPCPTDGNSYCLTVVGEDVAGTAIDTAELIQVNADQAAQCQLQRKGEACDV